MAQLIISAAGAAIGFAIGGPAGAQWGWALGSMVGASVAASQQRIEGPRLGDLRVTGTEYGQPIAWLAGRPRVAGQIWWASDRREIRTTRRQGKGGGPKVVTYTYEVDLLIGLGEGPAEGIVKVWRNGKLVYDVSHEASPETVLASQNTAEWARMTFYGGGIDQLPDPTYEAAVGAANAVAYRGRACVFIEGLQLGQSGQIDNLTFQLGPTGPAGAFTQYAAFDSQPEYTGSQTKRAEMVAALAGATTRQTGFTDLSTYVGTEGIDFPVYSSALQATFVEREPGDDGTLGATRWIRDPDTDPPEFGRFDMTGDSPGYWLLTNRGFRVVFDQPVSAWGTYMTDLRDFGANVVIQGYVGTELQFTWNFVDQFGEALTENAGKAFFGFVDTTRPPAYTSVKVTIVPGDDPELLDFVGFDEMFTARVDTSGGPPPPIALRTVVEAVCERAGIAAADVDASALDTITRPVHGLAVGSLSPARAVLEQLMLAYGFSAVLDERLRFVPRSGAPVATIEHDDLGAGLDRAQDEPFALQMQADLELPPQVAVTYPNVQREYNPATEWSDRLVSAQSAVTRVDLAVGMTPAEAKAVADFLVRDAVAQMASAEVWVPLRHGRIQPTDVVTVLGADGTAYRMWVQTAEAQGTLHRLALVRDLVNAQVDGGLTDDTTAPPAQVQSISATTMALLDLPLLRDEDDGLAHYVAAKPAAAGLWSGASIQRSEGGTEYQEVASVAEQAVIGTATTVLGGWTGGHVFDERNAITVSVAAELSSSTRAAMLADRSINVLLVGSEIIRFRTASAQSPGVYRLSGLLRGLMGTEWAMGTHVAGERVVLLRADGVRRITVDLPSLGVARSYKAVSFGQSLAAAPAQSFTWAGVMLKPWAPVHLRVLAAGGSTVTIGWRRRTRRATVFGGPAGIVVPLGEAAESYLVQSIDGSNAVVASTVVTTPQATISSTGVARVRVAQISALVGPGYAAELEL